MQALIHRRVEEFFVNPSFRPALLEAIMQRSRAFLTKGYRCPFKPLVGFNHEIEVMGKPFKEHPPTQNWRSPAEGVGGGNPEHVEGGSHTTVQVSLVVPPLGCKEAGQPLEALS